MNFILLFLFSAIISSGIVYMALHTYDSFAARFLILIGHPILACFLTIPVIEVTNLFAILITGHQFTPSMIFPAAQ
jgi:hypothetical protein